MAATAEGVAAAAGVPADAVISGAVEAPAVAAVRAAAAAVRAAAAAGRAAAGPGAVDPVPEVAADALTQARQVPQAAPRAAGRVLPRPGQGSVRRVRAEGARRRLVDQPPDRGGPNRHDPQDQARRQGVDQRLSRQAVHQEARRDPNGLRQGLTRGLGRGRQAGPGDVRTGRGPRAAGPRGDATGRSQASGEDEVRVAGGSVKAGDLRDMSEAELREHLETARRDLFGLRFQHATGELDNTASLKKAKREVARGLTVANERGIEING